ncbi:hypothetical protein [Spirosoma pollinicola]|uniref:Uncharacterized protein n=1 Tax=Spirosoma pollinicola TaxID=2057025 RepID=A0A2K8ZAY2_9BACT|nr:hypothetical protein [Spirosoma pollinicola]AUD06990.1 hypothetical protein CWM47_37335 [Spirosoma pollinicola]
MQPDDVKTSLTYQIKEFLTYTADTDNDTIMAQYTLIEGLVDRSVIGDHLKFDVYNMGFGQENNADYAYFLHVNTVSSQPVERKGFALEGLQERMRRLLKELLA